MAAGEGGVPEDYVVAFPPSPTAGTLGVLVRASRVDEFRRLEHENTRRIWRVRTRAAFGALEALYQITSRSVAMRDWR
ncbi:MAG: hypothetical protein DMG97_04090 [Acidobacteria bacterium]|nr:MAG: hypothetical protein DMG97_04090 [Acidobacteriota bacterium]